MTDSSAGLDFGPHTASGRNSPSECEWKQCLNVTRKTKNRANGISLDRDSRLMEVDFNANPGGYGSCSFDGWSTAVFGVKSQLLGINASANALHGAVGALAPF